MSRTRVTRGRDEFTPRTVTEHRPARVGVRLHMKALHLATVKQMGEGQ